LSEYPANLVRNVARFKFKSVMKEVKRIMHNPMGATVDEGTNRAENRSVDSSMVEWIFDNGLTSTKPAPYPWMRTFTY
jgi:hypothetical protein